MSKTIQDAINEVERAVSDLRRGRPVILNDGKYSIAVKSVENITKSSLDDFKKNSGIRLILTKNRGNAVFKKKYGASISMEADKFNVDEIKALAGLKELNPKNKYDTDKASKLDDVALQFAKIAELMPAVLVSDSIKNKADLSSVKKNNLLKYEKNIAVLLSVAIRAPLKLKWAPRAEMVVFRAGNKEHYAIIIGKPKGAPYTRIHSSCFTGDLLASLECDCGDQLHEAIKFMGKGEGGILLYLNQEGRGIGLTNKLRAYALKASGMDTVEANEFLGFDDDERPYITAAEMLKKLGIKKVRLLTNNPRKVKGLEQFGIKVEKRVSHMIKPTEHTHKYLETKFGKLGHIHD